MKIYYSTTAKSRKQIRKMDQQNDWKNNAAEKIVFWRDL